MHLSCTITLASSTSGDVHRGVNETNQNERRTSNTHRNNATKKLMLHETAMMLMEADASVLGGDWVQYFSCNSQVPTAR